MSEREEESNSDVRLDLLSQVLPDVITAFRKLDNDGRQKLIRTVATLFGLESDVHSRATTAVQVGSATHQDRFSKDRPTSPKEFLFKKQPRTDVERVACLAYYLTHYRDQPFFKTLDISKLNTEAAQLKFSNPAKAVDNATMLGYLAQATKGNKQISAPGELFVDALPDRDAAQAAMSSARPRRRSKKKTKNDSTESGLNGDSAEAPQSKENRNLQP